MRLNKMVLFAVTLVAALTVCISAGAADNICEYTFDGNTVNITGTTETNSRVLLLVTTGTTKGDITYFDQKTGVNGGYDFSYTFPADAKTDDYTFTVSEMYVDTMQQVQTSFIIDKIDNKFDYAITKFNISGAIDTEGGVTATIGVKNKTNAEISEPVAVVAVYEKDTGRLSKVHMSDSKPISALGESTIVVNNPFVVTAENADKYFIKAFIWDSYNTLQPVVIKEIK